MLTPGVVFLSRWCWGNTTCSNEHRLSVSCYRTMGKWEYHKLSLPQLTWNHPHTDLLHFQTVDTHLHASEMLARSKQFKMFSFTTLPQSLHIQILGYEMKKRKNCICYVSLTNCITSGKAIWLFIKAHMNEACSLVPIKKIHTLRDFTYL